MIKPETVNETATNLTSRDRQPRDSCSVNFGRRVLRHHRTVASSQAQSRWIGVQPILAAPMLI